MCGCVYVGLGPLTRRVPWLGRHGGGERVEWGSARDGDGRHGGGVLASRWCWFDLSLMSSQHMAAPGSLQGPARPPAGPAAPAPEEPPLAQKRANFHTAQSASLKGKSHFPGRAAGSASLHSLARCHQAQMQRGWARVPSPIIQSLLLATPGTQ